MKVLVGCNEVRAAIEAQKKELIVPRGAIVTAAARDMADQARIRLVPESAAADGSQTVAASPAGTVTPIGTAAPITAIAPTAAASTAACGAGPVTVDQALIMSIVSQVLARLPSVTQGGGMVVEVDPSGVRLIRGDTVRQEPFNTGNPKDRVTLTEILTAKESPMCAGLMTMEKSAFSWDLGYAEIDLILEGALDITVNGRTVHGKKGDVFFIPQGTTVTFGCPESVKFFFVTYPANWAELSN
jgi:ethanolamine utilization protein EutQ